jgi:hypothetical protein
MTKGQLIELFQISRAGGNMVPDLMGKLHPQVLEKYFELAYNMFCQQYYNELKANRNYSKLNQLTKSYMVNVNYNTDREKYYSLLPASLASIPDKDAIRQVSALVDESYAFTYMEPDAFAAFDGLEVTKLDIVPSFTREGKEIIYYYHNTSITQVLMKLVVSFSDFTDDDDIQLPPGKDVFIFDTVMKLMEPLMRTPEDVSNDNNSKIA